MTSATGPRQPTAVAKSVAQVDQARYAGGEGCEEDEWGGYAGGGVWVCRKKGMWSMGVRGGGCR